MKIEALRQLSDQLREESMEDEKSIDFGSVGLYLAGLQVVFAIVCCACTSVLCCWLLPPHAISAVRTLAITTALGLLLIRKPLRIGRVRGVSTVFNALRPCVAVYVLALVLEQLVHTCVVLEEGPDDNHGVFRRILYHIISVFLIISGFVRAKNPRAESDGPFLLALLCLLATALLPPPAMAKSGPLCEPTSLLGAGERVLRALLFACVYVVLVYAAAPNRNIANELFICVARATAASVWVLSATSWALPLAPMQAAVVLFARLHDGPDESDDRGDAYSESMPLRAAGAMTPNNGLDGAGSDIETASYHGGEIQDPEALKLAIAAARPVGGCGGGMNGHGGSGLSFNFARGASQSVSIAAVAAREAARELNGGQGSGV